MRVIESLDEPSEWYVFHYFFQKMTRTYVCSVAQMDFWMMWCWTRPIVSIYEKDKKIMEWNHRAECSCALYGLVICTEYLYTHARKKNDGLNRIRSIVHHMSGNSFILTMSLEHSAERKWTFFHRTKYFQKLSFNKSVNCQYLHDSQEDKRPLKYVAWVSIIMWDLIIWRSYWCDQLWPIIGWTMAQSLSSLAWYLFVCDTLHKDYMGKRLVKQLLPFDSSFSMTLRCYSSVWCMADNGVDNNWIIIFSLFMLNFISDGVNRCKSKERWNRYNWIIPLSMLYRHDELR